MMPELDEILRYWAADRENVSVLNITDLAHDFDKGWGGSDVTPGDPPTFVITYNVSKKQVIQIEANNFGNFITELSKVAARGPFRKISEEQHGG